MRSIPDPRPPRPSLKDRMLRVCEELRNIAYKAESAIEGGDVQQAATWFSHVYACGIAQAQDDAKRALQQTCKHANGRLETDGIKVTFKCCTCHASIPKEVS